MYQRTQQKIQRNKSEIKEIENDINYWNIDCKCGSKYKWTVYLNDSCYCSECTRLVPAAEAVFACTNKHKKTY